MKKPGFTSSTFTGLSWTRRKFLTLGAGAIPLLTLSRKNQAEDFDYQGNPFRDRFQSFRRTFRVEPDREEAERIVRHIIRDREPRTDLIDLDVPDIAENGSAVPVVAEIVSAPDEPVLIVTFAPAMRYSVPSVSVVREPLIPCCA